MKTNYRIYRTQRPRFDFLGQVNWPMAIALALNVAVWGGLTALWYCAQK